MGKNLFVKEIVSAFNFEGKFVSDSLHDVGNINDTFVLEFEKNNNELKKYIVQRINHHVFTKPVNLMENIEKVTSHIINKVKANGGNPLRETLNLVRTNEGGSYYVDSNGDYWRAFLFIEGATTFNKAEKPEHMYEVGKALGKFQNLLSDFKAEELFEIIEDFHNTPKRYKDFVKAMENDPLGRVKNSLEEIKFIMDRADSFDKLINLLEKGRIPLRVTHNDTKINNIMIDDVTGQAVCLIDLDTVMPGLSLYDFGDAIRSGCSTAEEEETDLTKVNFNMEFYNAFTKGLLEECKDTLNKDEIENIGFSAKLITLELAMRFLTDYLNGDVYFKTARKHHNLDRCRNQLKLASEMEKVI